MCPNCYTMAVYHVKLRTKFTFFCIPLFPITKGKSLYLCERCHWASEQGPPQMVPLPQPPPGYAVTDGSAPLPPPPPPPAEALSKGSMGCPQCYQPLPGSNFQFCPHCGMNLRA
ncbi:hypothetical protein IWQ60_005076 [Tieghemiomyces parasiticus]|uniref:Zinc-ribbon 15 domain-containing protein n=1 Tax=Tieghemiomyces parasiticus TaxID=78921 RepID=A0A9W8AF70_9FUNG|nr:hypothetical protein IWQ60_005076 [Tieghemiomyces parasiticus]